MAKQSVSGRTAEQLAELRQEYDGDMDFERRYCLAKIPHQPEDYDGPQRYCVKRDTRSIGDAWLCPYHGGSGSVQSQNLEKLAAMKHGMTAAREHLIEDFDEKDRALYDWIMESYPEAYDIDVEESPADAYDLHRLAAEIVRAERGRGFLIEEGEVNETEKYTDEGVIVRNDEGDVVTEKSEHYLSQMMHRQDKKITQLQKELGITRKERERRDTQQDAADAVKAFSELGKKFLDRDNKEYDPENEPWDDDESD